MEHRVKLLRIAIPMLPNLLRRRARWELVEQPLPDDAVIVACRLERPTDDVRHATLVLTVASAEFPAVPEGGPIPEMEASVFHDPRPVGPLRWLTQEMFDDFIRSIPTTETLPETDWD